MESLVALVDQERWVTSVGADHAFDPVPRHFYAAVQRFRTALEIHARVMNVLVLLVLSFFPLLWLLLC